MKYFIKFVCIFPLLLVSCGGGGGGGSSTPSQAQTPSTPTTPSSPTTPTTPANSIQLDELGVAGNVIDGYVSGATVFIDENFNLTYDEGELSAVTGEGGFYNIYPAAEESYKSLVYWAKIEIRKAILFH